ncbi:unnamed protein product [Zymoseptoria tritici ST99CH_3D7]|uniref:Uncharacterized protein n=3 Tax=Zymoseptoria tritici TaxID=1047171 RepID=A0A1X7RRW3_ZYMT9|nr:unnamed protein product [Zymoseptoria tritici ST99CH_3D7]
MSIQKAVEAGDSSELGRWLKKASKAIGFDDLLAQLAVVKLENLPNDILNYIRENPGQVAFFVLGAVVLIAPVLVWGPAFAAMGWSAKGIQAGSFAARWQSVMAGHVVKKGVFATMTSASMGGYGMAAANGAVRTGAALAMVSQGHPSSESKGQSQNSGPDSEATSDIEDGSDATLESGEDA